MTAEQNEMIQRSKQLVGIDLDRPSLLRHEGLREKSEVFEGLRDNLPNLQSRRDGWY
jgi:hypothetical protein